MNQLELIEKETRNNDNTLFHIYLYNEGDWWRAYEWSAYLCTHINMTDGLILKPTHKNLKGSDNGIIFTGLKLSSFKKYFKNYDIPTITDGIIEIDVTNNIINNENINIDNYKTILNEWKFSVPIKEKIRNEISNNIVNKENDKITINDLLKIIINYPLENKSLLESVRFISDLKKLSTDLI